jgi:hypothetical protein
MLRLTLSMLLLNVSAARTLGAGQPIFETFR